GKLSGRFLEFLSPKQHLAQQSLSRRFCCATAPNVDVDGSRQYGDSVFQLLFNKVEDDFRIFLRYIVHFARGYRLRKQRHVSKKPDQVEVEKRSQKSCFGLIQRSQVVAHYRIRQL